MTKKDDPKFLNRDEAERLLNQPNRKCPTGYRNYVMIRLMLNAGLRVSECTNLRKNEVDFTMGRVFVNQSKGAKDRSVWINEEMINNLLKWIDWRDKLIEEGKYEDPKNVDDENYIFITRNGTKLSNRYMWGMVKRQGEKAGIELPKKENGDDRNVTPHTLRHTYATELLRNTNNIRKVQKALGHENISTTQIYTHVVDEELEEDMKNLCI